MSLCVHVQDKVLMTVRETVRKKKKQNLMESRGGRPDIQRAGGLTRKQEGQKHLQRRNLRER